MAFDSPYKIIEAPIQITYNWSDIAAGTGMADFYLYSSKDSSGTDYHMSQNLFYSTVIEASSSTSAATYTKLIDYDFDLSPFNLSATIEGTATIQACMQLECTGSGSAGDDVDAYMVARIRKWDGTTETEIADNTSETLTSSFDDGGELKILNFPITVPKTRFAPGETLRVTIEGWARARDTKDARIAIGLDPINRDGTYINPSTDDPISTTQLKASIPFRIFQ
jgi:hypothetical protein